MDLFERIDTEEKAYFLGFMYADGCIYYSEKARSYCTRLKLATKDRDILFRLSSLFSVFTLGEYKEDIVLRSYNKQLALNLISLGVLPDKSYSNKNNLKLPDIPKELRFHFIRGFWDGDGCIYKRSEYGLDICVVNTSEVFLESLAKFLNNNEIECLINGYNGINENLYRLRITKQRACLVFKEKVYKDATIYLERKYNKIINYNPPSIKSRRSAAMKKRLAQKKSDELLEISQEEWEAISSQAKGTPLEGSETT